MSVRNERAPLAGVMLAVGLLAALVLAVAGFLLFRGPTQRELPRLDAAPEDPATRWQPPPPASASVKEIPLAPPATLSSDAPPPSRSASVGRRRIRGRLVGISPSVPWQAPIFVLPAEPGSADGFVVHSTFRWNRSRKPIDGSESAESGSAIPGGVEVMAAWDPVTQPVPTFENFPTGAGSPIELPRAAVAADGTFEIDCAPLFAATGFRDTRELEIIANDRRYLPERRSVALDATSAAAGFEWDVEIEVRLAACVTGRVDARDRGPRARQRPMNADVALMPGTLDDGIGAPTETGLAADRFLLRAPKGGRFTVVFAADDLVPAAIPVDLAVGHEVELPDVVLDRGVAITGVVEYPPAGPRAAPILSEGAAVTASLETGGGSAIDLPRRRLLFSNGRLETRATTVSATRWKRGRAEFTVGGLTAGRSYRVFVGELNVDGDVAPMQSRPIVVAPAKDVRLLFDLAYIAVEVTCGRIPVESARVSCSFAKETILTSGTDGKACFLVAPFQEGKLGVEAEGCEPVAHEFESGPAGSVMRLGARLTKQPVHAELSLRLASPAVAPIRFVRLRFDPLGAGATVAFVREAASQDSTFRFTDLPEGTFRVSVLLVAGEPARRTRKPDEPQVFLRQEDLIEPTVDVELTRAESRDAEIELRAGGVVWVKAHDVSGEALAVDCELADAEGRAVDFQFAVEERGSIRIGGRQTRGAAMRVVPALKPGRYVLTVARPGFETKSVPFEVAAAETKDLDVALPRQR